VSAEKKSGDNLARVERWN